MVVCKVFAYTIKYARYAEVSHRAFTHYYIKQLSLHTNYCKIYLEYASMQFLLPPPPGHTSLLVHSLYNTQPLTYILFKFD